MKYLIIPFLLMSVGCHSLQKLVNGNTTHEQPASVAPHEAYGTVQTLDTWISVDVGSNQPVVKVRRAGEDWVILNKYEFTYDTIRGVLLKHKVTVLPNGQLTFKIPYEPVAPIGTEYSIMALETQTSLY